MKCYINNLVGSSRIGLPSRLRPTASRRGGSARLRDVSEVGVEGRHGHLSGSRPSANHRLRVRNSPGGFLNPRDVSLRPRSTTHRAPFPAIAERPDEEKHVSQDSEPQVIAYAVHWVSDDTEEDIPLAEEATLELAEQRAEEEVEKRGLIGGFLDTYQIVAEDGE